MKGGRTPIHLWRKWCPSDLLEDELIKLCASRGDTASLAVYFLVLQASHRAGGDLSSDREELAASLGMSARLVERGLRVWLERGKLVEEDGRLFHRRVRREVASELEFRDKEVARKRAERGGVSSGRPADGQRTSDAPAPLAVRRTPYAESRTERNGPGESEQPDGPSVPSGSHDNGRMTEATARAIEALAGELGRLTGRPASEAILTASRIEPDGRGPGRSFSDPRRPGLSEAWGLSTRARLQEQLDDARRPVPL